MPSPSAVSSTERCSATALPSSNGCASGISGWTNASPCSASGRLAQERRAEAERVDRRAHVVAEAGQRQRLAARAAADRRRCLEHAHRAPGLRERDRGRQAVRAGAHHDRVDVSSAFHGCRITPSGDSRPAATRPHSWWLPPPPVAARDHRQLAQVRLGREPGPCSRQPPVNRRRSSAPSDLDALEAAVDAQHLARDEARVVRQQERDRAGDLVRLPDPPEGVLRLDDLPPEVALLEAVRSPAASRPCRARRR